MSREPDAVLSDSEEVTVQVPVTNWKDPRAYNAVLQRWQPCHAKGIEKLLQNKAKAINHWAGDGTGKRDATATLRGCFEAQGDSISARRCSKTRARAERTKAARRALRRDQGSRGATCRRAAPGVPRERPGERPMAAPAGTGTPGSGTWPRPLRAGVPGSGIWPRGRGRERERERSRLRADKQSNLGPSIEKTPSQLWAPSG